MFNMTAIGRTIARLRREHNLTQVALADQLGVSFQAVSLWETGRSMPDIAKLPDLAAIFGVRIDDLLGERAPAVTHAITGDLADRAADGAVTVQDLADAAPILPPDQINNAVQQFADRTNLVPLLPFLDMKLVDELLLEQARSGAPINEYLPFASTETVNQLMLEKTHRSEDVCCLLPFASREFIDRLMMEKAQRGEDINCLLPFASAETLRQVALLRLQTNRGIDELLPFLPGDFLGDLARTVLHRK